MLLNWLRDITHFIDICGLKVTGGKVRRLKITQLYTPLTTLTPHRRSEERAKPEDVVTSGLVPLQTVLNHGWLVLIGAPGSGKSTFLKRIAFAACETLLDFDATAAAQIFPGEICPFPILIFRPESRKVRPRKPSSTGQYRRSIFAGLGDPLPCRQGR
jgi:hypothetical protein